MVFFKRTEKQIALARYKVYIFYIYDREVLRWKPLNFFKMETHRP